MTTKSSCPFGLSTNLVKIVFLSLSLCFEFGTIVEKVVYFAKSYKTAELWLEGARSVLTRCIKCQVFCEKIGNFLIFCIVLKKGEM